MLEITKHTNEDLKKLGNMHLPELKFQELKDKTEKGLEQYIEMVKKTEYAYQFLVYIRQRDSINCKWHYSIQYCCYDTSEDVLKWEYDWDEGQEYEYVAVCCIC